MDNTETLLKCSFLVFLKYQPKAEARRGIRQRSRRIGRRLAILTMIVSLVGCLSICPKQKKTTQKEKHDHDHYHENENEILMIMVAVVVMMTGIHGFESRNRRCRF